MSLPELTPEFLILVGIAIGAGVLVLLLVWVVIRSAVLSALRAHQKKLNAGERHQVTPAATVVDMPSPDASPAQDPVAVPPPVMAPAEMPVGSADPEPAAQARLAMPLGPAPTIGNPYAQPPVVPPGLPDRPPMPPQSVPAAAAALYASRPAQAAPSAPVPPMPAPVAPTPMPSAPQAETWAPRPGLTFPDAPPQNVEPQPPAPYGVPVLPPPLMNR